MQVRFSKIFLKGIERIADSTLASQINALSEQIKEAGTLQAIPNLKKIKRI